MTVTNRDASLTTVRRKQKALYGWRVSTGYSGAPTTVLQEQGITTGGQGTGPSAGVSVDAKIGAGLCCNVPERGNPGGGRC
jgi:hypothetical protein